MLKGEDLVVLLKLTGEREGWTVRSLQMDTGISRSVVHRSLARLQEAGLLDAFSRRINVSQAEELLVHGIKYTFTPQRGGETRGIPTAWAASPLKEQMAPVDALPPVWPDPTSDTRGLALQPLHPAAVDISRHDPALAELIAIVDALRLGDARLREVAAKTLRQRLADRAESAAA